MGTPLHIIYKAMRPVANNKLRPNNITIKNKITDKKARCPAVIPKNLRDLSDRFSLIIFPNCSDSLCQGMAHCVPIINQDFNLPATSAHPPD